MNLEKLMYIQINKNFQAFKTLDSYAFNQEVSHFCLNNLRIENIAQLDQLILLINKCQNYNLIALSNTLDKLLLENTFFKKILSVYYKNQNQLTQEIVENIQKLFIVIYRENKDYILTTENEFTSFLKQANELDISSLSNVEKQTLLLDLLRYAVTFKEVKELVNYLNKQKVIIESLIEILKII
ncbi:hypothetical protein [Mesoplasma melaleucae]|uniref:Uncharacterized protein n=1 Tax=Mesoplasma melaleucae TaxID=81459 RepID=A0A2K8NWU9_9MOLU|nr:hypothetical protein [Mesoplasma melaleucae]ATZ18325.1 hypothetical protein EMELA_v1c08410 [Mesoplasma melaleucae]